MEDYITTFNVHYICWNYLCRCRCVLQNSNDRKLNRNSKYMWLFLHLCKTYDQNVWCFPLWIQFLIFIKILHALNGCFAYYKIEIYNWMWSIHTMYCLTLLIWLSIIQQPPLHLDYTKHFCKRNFLIQISPLNTTMTHCNAIV